MKIIATNKVKFSGIFMATWLSLMVMPAEAEENLLWKITNTSSPMVVPAYGGQPSPFPRVAKVVAVVTDTTVEDEQRRLRDEALEAAQKVVESKASLVPDLRPLKVGGTVEGAQGARVLIANQWLAIGSEISVRLYKSPKALEAIKGLAEYDSSAAEDLTSKLNAQLTSRPILKLNLQRITSGSLIFSSPMGPQEVKFSMDNM